MFFAFDFGFVVEFAMGHFLPRAVLFYEFFHKNLIYKKNIRICFCHNNFCVLNIYVLRYKYGEICCRGFKKA